MLPRTAKEPTVVSRMMEMARMWRGVSWRQENQGAQYSPKSSISTLAR